MSKKYLIVGAGPIGIKTALDIRKEIKDAEIEIVDKRFEAGGREEVLFLSEQTINTLNPNIRSDLFEGTSPKAFFSSHAYHYSQGLVPEKHGIVSIHDLEKALEKSATNNKMTLNRGLEFIDADKGIARFKNTETNVIVKKPYDELILAIGLSGVLKHGPKAEVPFEVPRLLHHFPVLIARYPADYSTFDPKKEPATIFYFMKDRMVGFFTTPRSAAIFFSIPDNLMAQLNSKQGEKQFIQDSLSSMPLDYHYLLEKIDFDNPSIIKKIPAVATLTPKLVDFKQHIHFIGDMVTTFPYVWGSETNVAYTALVPLLIDLLNKIQHCTAQERERYLIAYEKDVLTIITTNKYFLRISPFGEKIALGETKQVEGGPKYVFPGIEKLREAKPFDRAILAPIAELVDKPEQKLVAKLVKLNVFSQKTDSIIPLSDKGFPIDSTEGQNKAPDGPVNSPKPARSRRH